RHRHLPHAAQVRAARAQGAAGRHHGRPLLAGLNEDLVAACRRPRVSDERLLAAVRDVPRAEFVPEDLARRAYTDSPLPIPHHQVTTQPSLVAGMVDARGLTGDER